MARLYFLIAVAAFVAVAFAKPEPIGFEIVNDIKKFRAENPSIKLEPAVIASAEFHYSLGARKAGDKQLKSNEYKSGKGDRPEDYQIKTNFPSTSLITYVDITVEQNSTICNVYVTSGGIGENHISILVEAKDTTFLNTKAVFYGQIP